MKQTLKYIYGVVYENMKFAEAKHNLILTFSGAVIAFSTFFLGANVKETLFAVGGIIFALISILYSFVALVARKVRIKNKKQYENDNLIFYKHIIKYDEKAYIDKIKNQYDFTKIYKADKMDYHLAHQIIIISKLAWIKFLYFNFAVLFLFASILCIILSVLVRGGIW